jgi:hypothetical protein
MTSDLFEGIYLTSSTLRLASSITIAMAELARFVLMPSSELTRGGWPALPANY